MVISQYHAPILSLHFLGEKTILRFRSFSDFSIFGVINISIGPANLWNFDDAYWCMRVSFVFHGR
jgi:hypothetical protein